MDSMVRLSLTTKLPLSELLTWEPESIATIFVWLHEKQKAEQQAAKGR
jgi:hypothetical protein